VSPPGSEATGGGTTERQNGFPAPLSGGFAHHRTSVWELIGYTVGIRQTFTCRCEENMPEFNINDQGSASILDCAP